MEPKAPAVIHIARNFGESEELAVWAEYARTRGQGVVDLCPAGQPRRKGDRSTDLRGLLAQSRKRFVRAQESLPVRRFHIYHNGWGLDALASVDGAERCYAFFHDPFPFLERLVVHALRFAQGVLVPMEGMKRDILTAMPWIPARKIHVVPHPWNVLSLGDCPTDSDRRPGGITGFASRLEYRQKRADRLPEFLEAAQVGPDDRIEVFEVGNQAHRFRRQWRKEPRLSWRVERSLADRMQRLHQWDYALFLGSYEGLPLGLLQAVAAAVIPIFPKPGNGLPAIPLAGECLYEAGEVGEAACRWKALQELTVSQRNHIVALNRKALKMLPGTAEALEAFVAEEKGRPHRALPRKAVFGSLWPLWAYNQFIQFARSGQWSIQRFWLEERHATSAEDVTGRAP